ncbi:MAG TPA: S-layer homology domain-containing protein [Anaerolineales bacterium]|nr:S-layer homology domain-containing protein [Anaerolineales bacterium]
MKSSYPLNYFLVLVFLLSVNIFVPTDSAHATSLTVDITADENDGSCLDGDCSLRDAIAVSSAGDTITINVTGTIMLSLGELIVDKSVDINGPGSGLLTLDGNNLSRIFNLPEATPSNTVSMTGLTMANGYADPNNVCGGGAIANNAFLTLHDVIISNSSAPRGGTCLFPLGGAILVPNGKGSLTITNSIISGNSTYWDGGGIYFASTEGSISLNNVTIDNNQSTNAGGGGLYVGDADVTVTINNSTISNNAGNMIGGAKGGGLAFYTTYTSPDVSIDNSLITLNSAMDGGGIYSKRLDLTIQNSTISENTSTTNGGGVMLENNITHILGSTFKGNKVNNANGNGGGIMNLALGGTGDLTVVNSTFAGNTADNGTGGGIKNQASGGANTNVATTTVINSTISGNQANNANSGGGIFAGTAGGSEVSIITLFNSIVYGNTILTDTNGENCSTNNNAAIVTAYFNLFQNLPNDCVSGPTDISSDLEVSSIINALASNGGATQTMSLPSGSPAIDAGDPAICTATPVNNESQNGFTRSLDGKCDIGAYELDNIPPEVLSINRASPNPTTASNVEYIVTFSEAVTGLEINDFLLVTSGVTNASITNLSGTGSTYTIIVDTGAGGGSLWINLPDTATIQDVMSNSITNLPFYGEMYDIARNFAPTDIALSASSLTENLPSGTTVGTFSTADPDTGDTFTYSLVSGNGSTDNAAFTISGNTLQSAQPFNFLNKNSYSIRIRSTDSGNSFFEKTFIISITDALPIFADVPDSYWAISFIERLYNAGITGGCSSNPLNYCPENTVTRAQMAVFLLKGIHGSSFIPPAIDVSTGFNDVASDYWAAAWIKQLAVESITGGCGGGNYCPDAPVTRAQMAVFLLKAKHGASYSPHVIDASGFTDVATDYWAAIWIKQLAAEGITSGCSAGMYCPEIAVTRAQMAVFLVKAFNLP